MHISRLRQNFTLVIHRPRVLLLLLLGLTFCSYVILVTSHIKSLPSSVSLLQNNTSHDAITNFKYSYLDLRNLTAHSIFDTSGKYQIISYFQTAQNWTELSKASLCTGVQASLDRMDLLPNFIASWSGPLSIAVFAPGQEFSLVVMFIRFLRHCNLAIREQVSFHVVFPVDRPPEAAPEISLNMTFDCNVNSSFVLQTLLTSRSEETVAWRDEIQYPQNLLRNVARYHCQTPFVTCIDIDMVFPQPSPHVQPSIMDQLNIFLATEAAISCELCAFVLPIFELDYSVPHIPSSKGELLALKKADKARQYHVEVFPPNQGLAKLNTKWSKLPPSNGVKIAYTVSKFEFWFEPVYIAKREVPRFDERYVGFGMVRNTQAYEMFLAGYTFHILDNVFLSHWGYQKKKVLSKKRIQQTNANFLRFINTHVRELAVRYDRDPLNLLAKYSKKKKHDIVVKKAQTEDPDQNTVKSRRRRSLKGFNNRRYQVNRMNNDRRMKHARRVRRVKRRQNFSDNLTTLPIDFE